MSGPAHARIGGAELRALVAAGVTSNQRRQAFQAPVNLHLDGRLGCAGAGGRLGDRQALELGQHNGLALRLGQRIEQRLQVPPRAAVVGLRRQQLLVHVVNGVVQAVTGSLGS